MATWTRNGVAQTSTTTYGGLNISGDVTIGGATQLNSTLTTGVDEAGVDVMLHGATASEGIFYDASADELALLLTTKLKFWDIGGGEEIYSSTNGLLDIKAGLALAFTSPFVNFHGVAVFDDQVLIGSSPGNGYDFNMHGESASKSCIWDASDGNLRLTNTAKLAIGSSSIGSIYYTSGFTHLQASSGGIKLGTENSGIEVSIGHAVSTTAIGGDLEVTGGVLFGSNGNGNTIIAYGAMSSKKLQWSDVGPGTDTLTIIGDLVVGVDGTQQDVIFYSDGAGKHLWWDGDNDSLELKGEFLFGASGGISGTTYDAKFWGNNGANSYMLWDVSQDDLIFGSDVKVGIGLTDPDSPLEIWGTGNQIKLSYSDSVAATLSTDSSGDLTISADGGTIIDSPLQINGEVYGRQAVSIPGYLMMDINLNETFVSLQGYVTGSQTFSSGMGYVFPCDAKLKHVYYIASGYNPNDTLNVATWRCYRYRPDGSTNTGDFKDVANWTTLQAVPVPNVALQAVGRGIFVDFTDGTCTFSKGDQMGISVQNSVDVSSNVLDQINVVVVVELDWTRELSANI